MHSITFCTAIMNRLHHFRTTFERNILDNESYSKLQFIVLDYNSSDGLEDWMKINWMPLINSKRVVYARTVTPRFFNRSHSRNMMFRLAQSDIIGNLDADVFTGKHYASFVNSKFSDHPNTYLRVADYRDLCGKFAVLKNDFETITGYDESMSGYGYEDIDLYTRLKLIDRKPVFTKDPEFLKFISHEAEERTKNEKMASNLEHLYITFNSREKQALFLMKDGNFDYGTLIPNNDASEIPILLKEHGWRTGRWSHSRDSNLVLEFNNGDQMEFNSSCSHKVLTNSASLADRRLFLIDNKTFLRNTLYMHPMLTNRAKHEANVSNNRTSVNENGFGRGEVYINFSKTPTLV